MYFHPDELNLSKGTKVRVTGGDFEEGQEGVFLKVKGARDRVVVEIQGVIAVAMATIHPDLYRSNRRSMIRFVIRTL